MKKFARIILGLIVFLLLAFLATGMVVKQTKYTTSVTINESVEKVFQQFSNPQLMKHWMTEIKTVTPIKETPNKVGSVYEIQVNNDGKIMMMTAKVLEYTPHKSMTLYFDSDLMLKTDVFHFETLEKQTIITKNTTIESDSYLMSCVFPWIKSTLKVIDQQPNEKFKKMVEKNSK